MSLVQNMLVVCLSLLLSVVADYPYILVEVSSLKKEKKRERECLLLLCIPSSQPSSNNYLPSQPERISGFKDHPNNALLVLWRNIKV